MRLEWTPFALEDRDRIFAYIERENPIAAIVVDDRIRTQVETLVRFPQRGRPGRIAGTRELVIDRTPYIAPYRVQDASVRILRVLHGAQLWPAEPDGHR